MDTKQLLEQIGRWYQEDEHQKIIDAVLAIPQADRGDELLEQLAVAYNNLDDYDAAIVVLEQLRPRQENTDKWQFRMGYALYYLDKNEEAKVAFSRCLLLNDSGEYAEDCRELLEEIETEFCQAEEFLARRKECGNPEVYDEAQWDAVDGHITQYFGKYASVFHEILSPDIHVDICVISPNEKRDYYTLVTMGMGAHRMNVAAQLAEHKLERAELVIALPPDWKVGENDEVWYWPTRLLKQLARLPIECDTWLGWGHTVDNGEPYAENTRLCGSVLLCPVDAEDDAEVCPLPNDEEVNFYQVLPLYREEMEYKQQNNAEGLFKQMGEIPFVVEADRPNCCEEETSGSDPLTEVAPTPLARAMMRYLDCPCRYFAPTVDDDELVAAYHESASRGKVEGFVPMLVAAKDKTLWECLIMNSDEDSEGGEDYSFAPEAVAAYRKEQLQASLPQGEEVLAQLREEAAEDDVDWDEEARGELAGGEVNNRFLGYWNYGTNATMPLILAEIPVKFPWEVFAYLPFGGWNACPDTPALMAVCKYWFERHGAVPAVMTHDVLEFALSAPVKREQAMELALEQYAWCPDTVDQGGMDATVGSLADGLCQSKCWYFWWD